jgi:hypothetical protein
MGSVITVAQPAYDRTHVPPTFIGIAGIDVLEETFHEFNNS